MYPTIIIEITETIMGRQVYISDDHHSKLKILSAQRDIPMGELVEQCIDDMEIEPLETTN